SEQLFQAEPASASPARKREIITLDLPSRAIVDTSTGVPDVASEEDWVVGSRPEPLRKPEAPPRRSALPGVLAVLAVFATVALVYWFGVRNRSAARHASVEPQPMVRPALGSQGPPDAAPAPSASEAVATARLAIIAGDAQQLRKARTVLATYEPAGAEVIALRSRTAAALAQSILDRAIIAGSGGPDSEVEALGKEAAELAALAAKTGADPQVALAAADAARLTGDRGIALRRTLKPAKVHSPIDYVLIDAMTYERDGDFRNARRSLEGIVADADASGDPRPRFRLALLLFRSKELAEARRVLAALLESQPTNLVAKELAAAIEQQAKKVAKIEPTPPTPPAPDTRPKESFETLVARAEELAEQVKCTEALALYARALEINRRSVTVLSGMGYCEIERGKMAAAHQRFRAALKISPGHIDSLLGEAETFQQEGLRTDAIDAYRRVLARNPSEYHQKIARRQIKALGGDPDEGAPPAPAPTPEPAPAPEDPAEP
ncbi:MAG TPA: tetratricopeptide repeat protein, partial [Kofleriaceae bacterium]|nr:tetratricopeptide repeat protein [Kofleriaceae bacterium]